MRVTRAAGRYGALTIATIVSMVATSTWIQIPAGASPAARPALAPAVTVGPVDPLSAALTFGVMTEGNAKVVTNESQGTMAVGGNLSFGGYQIGDNASSLQFTVPGDARPTALVVGGHVDFGGSSGTLQVQSQAYVKIGDLTGTFVRNTDDNNVSVNTRVLPSNDYNATPSVQLNTRQPVASVGPTSPINFANAFTSFRDTSASLGTCNNTLTLQDANGNPLPATLPPATGAYITLTSGVTNVLNISGANLNNIQTITFRNQPSASTPLLVNVDTGGGGYAWNSPNFSGISGPQAEFVLFNFWNTGSLANPAALSIVAGAQTIESSIYAPNATLSDNSASNTEGSIVAKTYDHEGGEDHYFPFSTTLSCTSTAAAAISVVKSSTTTSITTAGQQVPYRYMVTNTGGTSLSGVAVTDTQTAPSSNANLSAITCPVTTLAAGASTTCSATYIVTQGDIENGSVAATTTASGTPSGGSTVTSGQSKLTIPVTGLNASISLVKASPTTTVTTAGQQVPFTFQVTNTGGLTLNSVSVTDPPAIGITCPATSLVPGASTICTGTYTVTAADISSGSVNDSATASGTPPSGGPVRSQPSTSSMPVAASLPGISVIKSSTTTSITAAGQQVPYSFLIVNSGGVTLTGVHVTDTQTAPSVNANLGPITCQVTTLAPNASTTCTATDTVTQADITAGSVAGSATATGSLPGGTTVTSTPSPLSIPVVIVAPPAISLIKSTTTTTVSAAGQQVPYRFLVQNTGGVTLTAVSITETQTAPSSNANLGAITCPQTTLAAGATTNCTATYTVTQADIDHGSVADSAIASGTPPSGPAVTSTPSTLTITAIPTPPALTLIKSTSTASVTAAGQQVPYSFQVVNTGGLTITAVAITDTQTAPSSNTNLGPITCPQTTLTPGASTTCTATYTVTQADLDHGSVADSAIAHGTPPTGPAIASNPSTLSLPAANIRSSIALTKSSTTTIIATAGQAVPYQYRVTNTGGWTLTNISVTDSQVPPSLDSSLGAISCATTTLAPGASTTCTATYVVTQADLDEGSVTDLAFAHGTPPGGPVVDSGVSGLSIAAATLAADVSLIKSSTTTSITAVGQHVPYTFQVINTGGLTLTSVNVTDTQTAPSSNTDLGPISCADSSLTPGASTTCTATYTVTQAVLDHGSLADSGVAHGTPDRGNPVNSDPSTVTIPATALTPAVSVIKTTTTTAISTVGQHVPYSFEVVNTGGLALTSVSVTDAHTAPSLDSGLSAITCPVTALAPGATMTCTATYTVTQADLDHGSVTDTATAHGTPPSGPAVASGPSALTISSAALVASIELVKSTTTPAHQPARRARALLVPRRQHRGPDPDVGQRHGRADRAVAGLGPERHHLPGDDADTGRVHHLHRDLHGDAGRPRSRFRQRHRDRARHAAVRVGHRLGPVRCHGAGRRADLVARVHHGHVGHRDHRRRPAGAVHLPGRQHRCLDAHPHHGDGHADRSGRGREPRPDHVRSDEHAQRVHHPGTRHRGHLSGHVHGRAS